MKEVHPSRFQYAIYMLRIQAVSCKMTSKKSNFYSSMHKVIFFSSICEINKYICKVRVSFAMISSGKRASTRVERKKSIGETFYVSINDMLIVMMLDGKFPRFSSALYSLGTGKSLFAISSKI